MHIFKQFYNFLIGLGTFLQSFVLLGLRLYWGWGFFSAGRDKLSNISPIIEYFQSLNIPLPVINAYTVGAIECIGGACLLLGFATRLVSIPLIVVMSVAMITAHHDAFMNFFNDPQGLIKQTPFIFFLVTLILFVFGPGIFSIDALLKRINNKNANQQ